MQIQSLSKELSATTYPGRGIVLGKSADARCFYIAYFIMGRSENSRNRIFEIDGRGIRTKAFDESKMVDPSLIIYAPVRVCGDVTIVTNGDQTDTIYDALEAGKTFEEALRTRTFEPDAPNFTPRISGVVEPKADRYRLSILKSADGDPASTRRYFFDYDAPRPGEGHFIHTYQQDGNPLPSFEGEPVPVTIEGDLETFSWTVWDNLNADNKVSLFTRSIDLETGAVTSLLFNKHQGQ
ncbi:MAG: inosine monophosphate cyclohydrolase [Oscillospiraceae bacterium]|nr:inosine monophosphate cyclohydrolase [Oscillospiraceae bacterium]